MLGELFHWQRYALERQSKLTKLISLNLNFVTGGVDPGQTANTFEFFGVGFTHSGKQVFAPIRIQADDIATLPNSPLKLYPLVVLNVCAEF